MRLYDRLFRVPDPASIGDDFAKELNPGSLETLTTCYVEPSTAEKAPGSRFQFERLGYFCIDSRDSEAGKLVFNRVVALRDSWGKIAGR